MADLVRTSAGAGVVFDRSQRRAVTETAGAAATQTSQQGGPTVPGYAAFSTASTCEVLHLARDAVGAGFSLGDGDLRS
nr:hypothetical protein [Arthrobacter polaris]UIK90172.1 hypothetical protein J0916_07755 [Arthrobacter polaris]